MRWAMSVVVQILIVIGIITGGLLAVTIPLYCLANRAENDAETIEQGRKAAVEGMPPTANPNRPRSFYYSAWQEGWQRGYREKNKEQSK
jgi:hypothetical protein